MKTHKGLKKRVKLTARWKMIHLKCGWNHLLKNKRKSHRVDQYWKEFTIGHGQRLENLLPCS